MIWNLTNIFTLLFCIFICNLAGLPGEVFTMLRKSDWYVHLKKPAFHPKDKVFGPIWLTLYTLMGISLFITLNHGTNQQETALALFYFAILLIFNTFWSMVFLGFRSFVGGLIAIGFLLFITFITIKHLILISSLASILLMPYFLWISFLTILNFSLWRLNKT